MAIIHEVGASPFLFSSAVEAAEAIMQWDGAYLGVWHQYDIFFAHRLRPEVGVHVRVFRGAGAMIGYLRELEI